MALSDGPNHKVTENALSGNLQTVVTEHLSISWAILGYLKWQEKSDKNSGT